MTLLALALLLLPACAAVAGLLVWLLYRHETLDDGALLRHFLIIMVASIATAWGIGRTEAVRFRLHPELQIQAEIDAHPVYSTLKELAPDDATSLLQTLVAQTATGVSVPEAFLQARPLLTTMTNTRSGWVDQETRLMWGRVVTNSLKELQTRDSELCYRALSGQNLDSKTLSQAFSSGNTREFQQTVVRVYESAKLGMRYNGHPGDVRLDFTEAAGEYQVIKDEIEQQFGAAVAANFSSKTFPEVPTAPPDQVCAARIYQLEAMMKRPKAMAARLVDSALR
jgi:hypothetical protein